MITAVENPDTTVACGPEVLRALLAILDEQRRQATSLLEMVMDERQAVLDNDIQALTEINAGKVAALEGFSDLDRRCKQKMAEVATWIGMQAGPETTMRQLIERLEEPGAAELDKARSLLKNTLLQVRESNRTNQKLLNQCLELVDQSAKMLQQLFDPPAVYSKEGNSQSCLQEGVLVSNVA